MLAISHREDQGITILDLTGSLTFGEEDLQFRNDAERLLGSGTPLLLLNLSGLEKLDTTGLGTIRFAGEKARDAGGKLVIVNSNPSHLEILIEAQMETTFQVFKSEREALSSFFPNRDHPYDILEFVESMKSPGQSPEPPATER